jgi:hypothetical protein
MTLLKVHGTDGFSSVSKLLLTISDTRLSVDTQVSQISIYLTRTGNNCVELRNSCSERGLFCFCTAASYDMLLVRHTNGVRNLPD